MGRTAYGCFRAIQRRSEDARSAAPNCGKASPSGGSLRRSWLPPCERPKDGVRALIRKRREGVGREARPRKGRCPLRVDGQGAVVPCLRV